MLTFFKFGFFLGGIVSVLLGVFILLQNRKEIINKTYFGLSLCCALWSMGFFAFISSSTIETAYFWRTLMDVGAIILPAFWMHFLYSVLNQNANKKKEIISYYIFGIFLILLNILDYFYHGIFVREIVSNDTFNYYPAAGPGYYLFILFYIVVVPYSLYILIKNYSKNTGLKAQQIKYLTVASFLGFGGGSSAFLFTFNIPVAPYGIIFFAFYPITVAYAISRFRLFNIKLIATELFVFVLSLFVLVRTITAENTQEQILNGILFLVITIFGILLIKSVSREVEQREKIEKLAGNLEEANEQLQGLDKLKTEFVSFATHQIRAPLAAIKGYASLMLQGDYGTLPENLKEPVNVISQSSNSLAILVEDYLNVSRIEQGSMKYDIANFDFGKLVGEVVEEARPNIEKKGLKVEKNIAEGIFVKADAGKLKQIVFNLLDNSSKYTPSGSISVSLEKRETLARLSIKDTGVGISSKTMPALFQKFSRAEDASKYNLIGTGLGLYLASEIVKALGGRVWAESEGEGKGATFFVELRTV